MYPEVEQYIKTRDEAGAAYQAAVDASNAKHSNRYNDNSAYDAWRSEMDEAYRVQRVTTNEAWQSLTTSTDPLVRYIAENCKDYQGYATDVLEVLPAPLETLETMAADGGWCDIWDRFRDRAVEAGLFGDAPKTSPARRAVLAWLRDDYEMGRENVRHLTTLMDAAIAEAVAAAAVQA